MITRNLEKIFEETRQHFPCVLLTGPRQVGKSTFLRNKYENHGYSYVTLDDGRNRNMAIHDPKTFLEAHPWPVIIDEAQYATELFPEIESIINEQRSVHGNKEASGMFILTGSTRHQLLEAAEESMAGRVGIVDMDALSISEILDRNNLPFLTDIPKYISRCEKQMSFDKIYTYILKGSLPQLYDDPDTPRNVFYSSYISTYLEKDLKEAIEVKNQMVFLSFLELLASNTGEELIYETYSRSIGIASTTVKDWVSALEKTGIVYLVHPYIETSIVKRMVKRPKLYFFDTGLAAYLCGIDSEKTLQMSFVKGRFFETFAMNEIRKTFRNEGMRANLHYYRDNNQNEVDLVYVQDGTLHCIEMKSGTNFNVADVKGFKQLKDTKYVRGTNAIVCTSDNISALSDGTFIIPISAI